MPRSLIKAALLVASLLGAPSCTDEIDDHTSPVNTEAEAPAAPTTSAPSALADDNEVADHGDTTALAEGIAQARALGMEISLPGDQHSTFTSVTTASAANCPSGAFCLWEDSDFRGRMLTFRDAGCQNLGGGNGFNDKLSSWYNLRGANYRVYWDANCRGAAFTASNGARSSSLGGWNDQASSICRGAGCP